VLETQACPCTHAYALLRAGESTVFRVRGRSQAAHEAIPTYDSCCAHPVAGHYCEQGRACGIAIKCFTCVDERAVAVASEIISRMIAHCPPPLLKRLKDRKAAVAIVGERQKTPDIPEFRAMRYNTRAAPCHLAPFGPAAQLDGVTAALMVAARPSACAAQCLGQAATCVLHEA
jgi:hypothetical protein